MTYAIQTDALTKQYGKQFAVQNLDLKVPQNSIYGFLGPNGAGKSTSMKMILGLVRPTAGRVTILGKPMEEKNRLAILKQTGSLIESPSYYGHLTGRENLKIIARLKNAPEKQIDEVLQIVRMKEQQHKKAGHYSLGMKQRLGLAAALLGNPQVLLLDEPTNGLDPAGIQEIRELIRSLPKRLDMTVMISSHLLSEIDQMATHTGIIDKGELIYQDSLEHLHEHSRGQIRLKTSDNAVAFRRLQKHPLLTAAPRIQFQPESGNLLLPPLADEILSALIASLVQDGIGILRVEEREQSLEEIFLTLTGRSVSL